MIIDIIVGLLLVLLVGLGFFRGFVKSAVMLVKIPITIVASFIIASPIAAFFNMGGIGLHKALANWFNVSISIGRIISVIFFAVIIFIVIRIILHKLTKLADKAKEKKTITGKLDRFLGAAFGLLRFAIYFILAAIVFRVVTIIPFADKLHGLVFDGSTVAIWMYDLVLTIIGVK